MNRRSMGGRHGVGDGRGEDIVDASLLFPLRLKLRLEHPRPLGRLVLLLQIAALALRPFRVAPTPRRPFTTAAAFLARVNLPDWDPSIAIHPSTLPPISHAARRRRFSAIAVVRLLMSSLPRLPSSVRRMSSALDGRQMLDRHVTVSVVDLRRGVGGVGTMRRLLVRVRVLLLVAMIR